MAINTGIAWTDATWNPWIGCRKVSAGCKLCYMYRDAAKFGGVPNVVRRSHETNFPRPLRWSKYHKLAPGSKIFPCSWSDWFIEEADPWRDEAWDIVKQTPEFNYLILTKRVDNIESRLPKDWGAGWDNVWLGITTEDQENFDKRMPKFSTIPAKVRFLSIEPMLGPVNIEKYAVNIDWVITGGESDRLNAREMKADWPTDTYYQCKTYNIPFFHKQMGTYWAKQNGSKTWKGDDIEEWPVWLRKREFPHVDNAHN